MTITTTMKRNRMWAVAAVAMAALTILWGCASSSVDEAGSAVYMVIKSDGGSVACPDGVNSHTLTVENRAKTPSGGSAFNDIFVYAYKLDSSDTDEVESVPQTLITELFVKAASSAQLTIAGVFRAGAACTLGGNIVVTLTLYARTVGGDELTPASAQIRVSLSCNPVPVSITETNNCGVDGTVTLDAGAGYDSYSWSNGATTQTITVPGDGTSYTVTISLGGCPGSATYTTTTCP